MPTAPTCVAKVPIFQGLSAQEQLEVAQFAKAVTAKKGEILSAADSRDSRLLVVHYGRLNPHVARAKVPTITSHA